MSQGGRHNLTSTSWTTLPLPITSVPFGAVGVGWTDSTVFAVRCHDGIVDASMHTVVGSGQNVSYVAFCY